MTEQSYLEEARIKLKEKLERAREYLKGRHLLEGGHYVRQTDRFADTGKFERMVRLDEKVEAE